MAVTRRLFLAVATLGVAGCATSPVVEGAPAIAPSSPPPTQDPLLAAAAASVTQLRVTLDALSTLATFPHQPWAIAAVAQCDAHLARLTTPSPLSPVAQEPVPQPSPPPVPPAPTIEAAQALIDESVKALLEAAKGAVDGDLRLLFTSAAAATLGLKNPSVAPVVGAAEPHRLQPTNLTASVPIALAHAWALIYGLGVAVGRLQRDDPLRKAASARLASAKEQRNELRSALGGRPIEQPAAYELPTAMDSIDTIRQGWATLEVNLLGGYARLVAADAQATWRQRMLDQVGPAQSVSAVLPHWPGWTA